MKNEFYEEAVYNVKRFRNHASLAILCGNNEMEEAVLYWGVGNSQLVKEDYIELQQNQNKPSTIAQTSLLFLFEVCFCLLKGLFLNHLKLLFRL